MARYGIPAADVLATVSAARAGVTAGKVFEGAQRFDVSVLMPPTAPDPQAIGELLVGAAERHAGAAVAARRHRAARGAGHDLARGAGAARARRGQRARARSCQLRQRVRAAGDGGGEAAARLSPRVGAGSSTTSSAPRIDCCSSCRWRSASSSACCSCMFGELRSVAAVFACVPLALVGGMPGWRCAGCPSRCRRRSASSRCAAWRCSTAWSWRTRSIGGG